MKEVAKMPVVDNAWNPFRKGSFLHNPNAREPGMLEEIANELPAVIMNVGETKEDQVIDRFYASNPRYGSIPICDLSSPIVIV